MQRNCGLCVVYTQKDGAALLVGILKHNKYKDKLVERKVSMDTLGIKSAKLQDKFFLRVSWLSRLPRCRKKPQSASHCLE